MISQADIDEARQRNIVELWRELGLPGEPERGNLRSPWRDDGTASVQVGGARNIVYDFGTAESLDPIALVERAKECSFRDAVELLLGRAVNGRSAQPMHPDPVEQLARLRGWQVEALRALGAVADGNEVHFPMRNSSGNVTGWRRRRADNQPFGEGGPKALAVAGSHNGLIMPWPLPDGRALVVEGEADAAAALSAMPDAAVIGTPGAQPGNQVLEFLQRVAAGREVTLFPDPDQAGAGWQAKAGAVLRAAGCRVQYVPALPGADLDQRLRGLPADKRGDKLRELVQSAVEWRGAVEVAGEDAGDDVRNEHGKIIPLLVAEKIIKSRNPIIHTGGAFYEYDGGVYRRREEYIFERMAVNIIQDAARRGLLLDVMKLLQIQTAIESDKVNQAGRIINLKNGLLDLERGFLPHTPDFISTVQVPIDFDFDATCPAWDAALNQWFPNQSDVIELIQEWFGYCLVPDARQHKALILLGDGANGKSVLCEILKELVGFENVSAVSLNGLGRSFALAELYGKLVNLTIEAEVREGIEEGTFKQIVAGDIIQAERKFQHPFTFKATSKNSPPLPVKI